MGYSKLAGLEAMKIKEIRSPIKLTEAGIYYYVGGDAGILFDIKNPKQTYEIVEIFGIKPGDSWLTFNPRIPVLICGAPSGNYINVGFNTGHFRIILKQGIPIYAFAEGSITDCY